MTIVLPTQGSANWDVPLNTALSVLGQREPGAEDLGFKTWNFPLVQTLAYSSTQPVSGTVITMRMPRFLQPETLTGVSLYRAVAASGLTAAYVGLYSLAGTKLRESVNDSANWAATGLRQLAFTSTYLTSANEDLVAAALFVGTTPPGIAAAQIANTTSNLNGALTAANFWWATGPTAQTTLPASITMASRTGGLIAHWAGLH